MAEQASQHDTRVSGNGHHPDPEAQGETLLHGLVWKEPHDEIFVNDFIQTLQQEAYSASLHHPAWQQRFAHIKKHNPTLYKSKLLRAVLIYLGPQQGWQWDHEIDVFVFQYDRLVTVPLSSIATEDVFWLWEPYIPLKKLTMVEGDPEAGKTFLLLAIAAAVTRGFALPDQAGRVGTPDPSRVGNVLYLTAEDGLGDTLRPRAERLEADLDRLFVVPSPDLFPMDMQPFSLARPHLLSAAIAEREVRLVIMDPITAFLGAEMDMHRANEVRPVMTTLVTMAAQHNCAIVALRHWTKQQGGKARYRGQGNVDFTAAARSVLSVGESPEDERLRIVAQAKNSLSQRGASIVFEISDTGLRWAGTSTLTADELSAAQPQRHKAQRKDAMEWLRDYLKHGPQPGELVKQAAEAIGITEKTLRGARERLHVLVTKQGQSWYWRLPTFDQRWDRYAGMEDDRDEP